MPAVPFRPPMYHDDLRLASELQEEENALAREADVRVAKDAEFAASICDEERSGEESQSESESESEPESAATVPPATNNVGTLKELKYRPGA